jgi:cell division protein ZapA (FtsZ GTPase activity inhibitor)
MTPLQIAVLIGLSIVVIKFAASLFGYGNIPLMNRLVTVILAIFVTFELVKLVQAIALRFGIA